MTSDPISPLLVEVTWANAMATVTVHGVVEGATATDLMDRVFEVVADGEPEQLVLDLHDVPFADLAGARAIGAIHAALDGECPVTIRRPQPVVRRLFKITGWCADGPTLLAGRRRPGRGSSATTPRSSGVRRPTE
jgi:anti-anti-sigma factor